MDEYGNGADAVSLKYIKFKLWRAATYLKTKWISITLCAILGACFSFGYAVLKKTNYSAQCTFVLQDDSKSALSQYSGLASLAGINVDGGSDGLFQGDNIFELYRSRTMLQKTLLSKVTLDGKPQLLIDRYISVNELRKRWDDEKIPKLDFSGNPANFSRLQDSLIAQIVKRLDKKELTIIKPDKKLSIIYVTVRSKDELFAQAFVNEIVKDVNDFYIQTKTKKASLNVQILQKQADSVKNVINESIGGVANSFDASPNANPLISSLRVPSQRKQVDVQASVAVYGEIIKNLEIAKLSLRKETPLIQIIDTPILPLENDKISKSVAVIVGFIFGLFGSVAFYSLKNLFTSKS